ncbi:MAG: Stp1/IreP family PP2C-type Ser/Thr phosphatase [bacterium]
MDAFGKTDVGCKRSVNQDAFYIDKSLSIFMVADGMGGHRAGDLASRLAIRSIINFISNQVPPDHENQKIEEIIMIEKELCRSAVIYANNQVFQMAESRPELQGMGTTIDMIKIIKGYGIICHVGDSRVYKISNGVIQQLTKDHSQIQELIDNHQISAKEAEFSSLKNVITRALGGNEDIEVDTLVVPIYENDIFLLCTDGLTGVMENWEIGEELGMYENDLEEAVKGYIETTLERGAPDNVTVLIVGPADEHESLQFEDEQRNLHILKEMLGHEFVE